MVRVMARAHDVLWGDSMSLQAQGYMHFEGEDQLRFIPTTTFSDGQINQVLLEGQKTCGESDPSSPKGRVCISAKLGDYYSVVTLLKAANVTLTEQLRISGTLITINIFMTNIDDFWKWPIGFKPKYIVTPRLAKYSDSGVPPPEYFDRMVFDVASSNTATRTQRVVGIRFTTEVTTHMGTIDIVGALSHLAVYSVVFSIAKAFITSFLTFVYPRFDSLKHIHTLREVSQYQESVAEEHIKTILDDGKKDEDIALMTSDLLRWQQPGSGPAVETVVAPSSQA